MLSRLKKMFVPEKTRSPSSLADERLKAMVASLGEPEHIDQDTDSANTVDIYAFGRNFVQECDTSAEDDEGYVLVTSGMSDRLMPMPENYDGDETPAVELIWYVRELNPEYFSNLRWLAKLPFIDTTWFGLGHTVPMPKPPLSFSSFSTFFLLLPVIYSDRDLFEEIEQQGHLIGTLCVHLISEQEYNLVKTDDGFNIFVDLLDENKYPYIFNPARKSFVE